MNELKELADLLAEFSDVVRLSAWHSEHGDLVTLHQSDQNDLGRIADAARELAKRLPPQSSAADKAVGDL